MKKLFFLILLLIAATPALIIGLASITDNLNLSSCTYIILDVTALSIALMSTVAFIVQLCRDIIVYTWNIHIEANETYFEDTPFKQSITMGLLMCMFWAIFYGIYWYV